jgi:hypothetical protein
LLHAEVVHVPRNKANASYRKSEASLDRHNLPFLRFCPLIFGHIFTIIDLDDLYLLRHLVVKSEGEEA